MSNTALSTASTARYGGEPTPRVAIAGCGIGGIAQAVYLLKQGIETFTIFEKSEGPGGTWWDNRYPGAACDVPSLLYSYDFHLVAWDKTHGTQAEIQRYLEDVIDRYSFRDRIRFGVGLTRAVWDEATHTYDLTATDGSHHEYDVLVSAVGMLNVPNEVDWPGLDTFRGDFMHSARWDPTVDLSGKRVAVVGAGASAAQIVPELVPQVEHLYSFQREPGWVSPKNDHVLDADEVRRFSSLAERKKERRAILKAFDASIKIGIDPDSPADRQARANNENYIRTVFADRPDLAEILMPDYAVRCKRAVVSSTFLPALKADNVEVVPRGVSAVTADGIVDADGEEYQVDAIVAAVGFQTTNYLSTLDVIGRDGRSIHDVWADEPAAFLGITVPGFPNFFMLYGPNTHGTVVTFVLERQSEFVARDVARMARAKATAIEVRQGIYDWFQRRLQAAIGNVAAWTSGCHNYYLTPSGKNVVQWPWSHFTYARWTKVLRPVSSRVSTRARSPR